MGRQHRHPSAPRALCRRDDGWWVLCRPASARRRRAAAARVGERQQLPVPPELRGAAQLSSARQGARRTRRGKRTAWRRLRVRHWRLQHASRCRSRLAAHRLRRAARHVPPVRALRAERHHSRRLGAPAAAVLLGTGSAPPAAQAGHRAADALGPGVAIQRVCAPGVASCSRVAPEGAPAPRPAARPAPRRVRRAAAHRARAARHARGRHGDRLGRGARRLLPTRRLGLRLRLGRARLRSELGRARADRGHVRRPGAPAAAAGRCREARAARAHAPSPRPSPHPLTPALTPALIPALNPLVTPALPSPLPSPSPSR